MAPVGKVNSHIIERVKSSFRHDCIELLEWACRKLKSEKKIDVDWAEENITANIYTYIHNSKKAIKKSIFIECEHSLFTEDILNNRKKAKAANRLDMVLQHDWKGRRFAFNVEAKNLIEHNAAKKNRSSEVKANSVLRRYIKTGIDHFLKAHYPQGCLLGYVLNGTTAGVAGKLNILMSKDKRGTEQLEYVSRKGLWTCYISTHETDTIQLQHFLFDFCN